MCIYTLSTTHIIQAWTCSIVLGQQAKGGCPSSGDIPIHLTGCHFSQVISMFPGGKQNT